MKFFGVWLVLIILLPFALSLTTPSSVVPRNGHSGQFGAIDTSDKAQTNDLLDHQIKTITNFLKQNPDTNENSRVNSDMWRKLGLLLQTKDVRNHVGGGALQPEALAAFDKALQLNDDRDIALSIQVNNHKGMLLKMMGRGEEAIASHDAAFELASQSKDKCEALSNKAGALSMLGRVSKAADLYVKALSICPSKLSYYLPLVQCHLELSSLNRSGWVKLLHEIENSIKKYSSHGEKEVMDSSIIPINAFDSSSLAPIIQSEGSSVYWALFEVNQEYLIQLQSMPSVVAEFSISF